MVLAPIQVGFYSQTKKNSGVIKIPTSGVSDTVLERAQKELRNGCVGSNLFRGNTFPLISSRFENILKGTWLEQIERACLYLDPVNNSEFIFQLPKIIAQKSEALFKFYRQLGDNGLRVAEMTQRNCRLCLKISDPSLQGDYKDTTLLQQLLDEKWFIPKKTNPNYLVFTGLSKFDDSFWTFWDGERGAQQFMWIALRAKYDPIVGQTEAIEWMELLVKFIAETGHPILLFENSPRDAKWGIGKTGNGQNLLGRMLTFILSEYCSKSDLKVQPEIIQVLTQFSGDFLL